MLTNSIRYITAKLLLISLATGFLMPVFVQAQAIIQTNTNVAVDLRLTPTSLLVTPDNVSVEEGGDVVDYRAVAKYNYPDLPDPIPDRDVTNDPLTVWSVGNTDVALINTIGQVTPVSDLGTGAVLTTVAASYGGKSDDVQLRVTGVVPPVENGGFPTSGSGGGGGGSSGGNSSGLVNDNNNPPSESSTTENGSENNGQPVNSNENVVSPVVNNENPPNQTNPSEINTPSVQTDQVPLTVFNETSPTNSAYLPVQIPALANQVSPLAAVFSPEEVSPTQKELGSSRAFVTSAVARRFNLLSLRKNLLDRCYADLNNCTNIFRMFSNYDGINLDPNNLRLFPDLNGVKEGDDINKLALLGVVNGYYGIEQSPFLPDKNISNVEMYKIITTVLNTMEKGKADYKPAAYDYNTLFYKDIYASYLLNKVKETNKVAIGPGLGMIRLAHALSREGLDLIRSQTTPFADIRPDLYDEHWYYPIVYNRLCELQVIDCEKGSRVMPDTSPTPQQVDEVLTRFEKYIDDNDYDAGLSLDSDDDGILNIDENIIYLTNAQNSDTDGDSLKDGLELTDYKTDPNVVDTDYDNLSDGEEVGKYKTDPVLADTDGDSYSDGAEIREGSDPLDATSVPDDKNKNDISDRWESKYAIEVRNGSQDTDGDGVSDNLEYKYDTDPTKIDTDMDGYTDSEEILEILSDPKDPASPGDVENLPVIINNFQYGQIVADPSPMIKGIAPASLGDNVVQVQVLLRNEFGSELLLGTTQTDAKGRFVYFPDIEIKNGTYFLVARALNKGQVKLSNPVKIIIDGNLQVALAKPERLENAPIDEDIILKKLVLKVDSKDGRPVLYGSLSEFGSRVNVTWQSLVVSSALIADTTDGSFSIKSPRLDPGRHTVYIQTVRKRDNAMSKTLKVTFDLGVTPDALTAKDVAKSLESPTKALINFVAKQGWPFWLGVLVVLMLVSGGLYYVKLDQPGAKKRRK
ncbi:hypothetical protein IT412_00410 [Candidatus Peregrinibacteria bacterium]|nr:hypothetical protein [Candidatus Peregrinibacteria bacterium]